MKNPYSEEDQWIVARVKTFTSSLTIPLLAIIIYKAKPLVDYFDYLSSRSCSDSFTNKYFTGLYTTLHRDVYYLNVTSLVIACIILAFNVSDVIWHRINHSRNRLQPVVDNEQYLVNNEANI